MLCSIQHMDLTICGREHVLVITCFPDWEMTLCNTKTTEATKSNSSNGELQQSAHKPVICHIGMKFKKQFLDILSNCFLEPLVLEHTRGEVTALHNTQRVISRTITEPLCNSAQNTITFRSLGERRYNNLAPNFKKKKKKCVKYREITKNNY